MTIRFCDREGVALFEENGEKIFGIGDPILQEGDWFVVIDVSFENYGQSDELQLVTIEKEREPGDEQANDALDGTRSS